MTRRARALAALALAALAAGACAGSGSERAETERVRRALAAAPRPVAGGVLRGVAPWLFLDAERLLLANDRAHGALAGRTSRLDPAAADPLPVILDFREQLAAHGVELLFVAIPAKLAIYPDRLVDGLAPPRRSPDLATAGLVAALEERGVTVLDLGPEFVAARRARPEPPLFATSDTHWSPLGCRIAAEAVAARVRERWPELARDRLAGEGPAEAAPELAPIEGDLRLLLPEPRPAPERAPFFRAPAPGDGPPLPILLLGDSHLRVYRARRSGFADHLEAGLGGALEVVAVEAGGATAARQALARRIDRLAGKRLVVWLSAARFFVSGLGWSPVELPPASSTARDPAQKQRGGPTGTAP